MRRLSLYFTWLLVRTPLTANQVTILQEVCGVAGAVALGLGTPGYVLLGVALLQVGYVLDLSDGEVARWKGQASYSGYFLDIVGHVIVIPSFFFGLGYGAWAVTGRQEVLVAAFVSALFSLKLDHFTVLWIIDSLVDKSLATDTVPDITVADEDGPRRDTPVTPLRRWAEIILRYPWTMNILTVVAVINWYYPGPLVGGARLPVTYFATFGFAILHLGIRLWQIRNVMISRRVEGTFRKFIQLSKRFARPD